MSSAATMTDLLRRTILEAIEAGRATFKGLARDTGVSRMSIVRFAAGKRSIRLDMADKLAAHFGIEVRPAKKGGK